MRKNPFDESVSKIITELEAALAEKEKEIKKIKTDLEVANYEAKNYYESYGYMTSQAANLEQQLAEMTKERDEARGGRRESGGIKQSPK